MEIVADHMEKLMGNLKQEATHKIRALESLRVSEKNVHMWQVPNKKIPSTLKIRLNVLLPDEMRS
jgi:hypothetical protein